MVLGGGGGGRHNFWEIWRGIRANLRLLRGGYCVIFLLARLIFRPPPPPLLIIIAQSLSGYRAVSRKVVQLKSILSVRDNTERHDGLWLFTIASSSSRVLSAMEGGAMNTCLRSELLTCLLKFIDYFPDYLSALSRTLLRLLWTNFVETTVYRTHRMTSFQLA